MRPRPSTATTANSSIRLNTSLFMENESIYGLIITHYPRCPMCTLCMLMSPCPSDACPIHESYPPGGLNDSCISGDMRLARPVCENGELQNGPTYDTRAVRFHLSFEAAALIPPQPGTASFGSTIRQEGEIHSQKGRDHAQNADDNGDNFFGAHLRRLVVRRVARVCHGCRHTPE